jgi:hypothetical protein
MYYSRIFFGILLLSIIILPSFVDAFDWKTLSPLGQMYYGISSQNITCSSDLELIYKSSNEYPVCVKPQTAEKLIQRGWGISQPLNYLVKLNEFLIPYTILGGNVTGINIHPEGSTVLFWIHTTSNGLLDVTLPRALLDAKTTTGQDDKFVIFANGQVVNYKETGTTSLNRILSIPFPSGTQELIVTKTQILGG